MTTSMTTSADPPPRADEPVPAGWFPDPGAAGGRALRRWDGEAWTDQVDPEGAAAENTPAHWKRHPFAFVTHRWFHLLVIGAVLGVAGAVSYTRVESYGLLSATAFLFTVGVVTAFGIFVAGRLRLGQVVGWKEIFAVAIVGGIVGSVLADLLELGIHAAWIPNRSDIGFITGPVEESAKLIVPLALFASGRFRNPRAGLAIVLASAAGFGIIEATTHPIYEHLGWLGVASGDSAGLMGYQFGIDQPLTEVTHMVFSGMIAAVAWRVWHLRGGFRITSGIVGVVILAMALHSTMDGLGLKLPRELRSLSVLALVVGYFAFKWTARLLTPPDAIDAVPPGWRPHWLRSASAGSDALVGAESPAEHTMPSAA